MSLLSNVMSMATPFVVDRIAAMLGINSGLARTAINLALPAVLSAFAGKAATPAGASALFDAVSRADTNLFGNLDRTLSGANRDAFLNGSTATLNNLLGSGFSSQLASTITSKAGVGGAAASMLAPLVGQMALSGLAKNSAGLDASGLANLLSSEQSSFGTSDTVTPTARTTSSAPVQSSNGWLRWALPLLAVLALGWYFLGQRQMTTPVVEKPAVEVPAAATAVNIDGVDVGKSLNDVFGGLTTTLGGVKDAATAQSALPKITELAGVIDRVTGVAPKFTPENKGAIGTLISAGLPAVRALADKALAQQGVGDVLKPMLDGLFTKIEALAK